MTQHTLTIRADAAKPQHACRIIENIINPALRDYGCRVGWPDLDKPEISVTYDTDELREAFKLGR